MAITDYLKRDIKMATGIIPSGKTLYYGPNANNFMQALTTNYNMSCSVLWREGSYYCVELSSPYRRLYIAQSDVNVSGTVLTFNPSGGTRYITSENYDFYLGPGTYYSSPPAKIDFPFSVGFLGKKEGDYALIEYTHFSYPRKFRAWFYSNALSTASREPGEYTDGHQINYEGDKWRVNNPWNRLNGEGNAWTFGHLGIDVDRRSSNGASILYGNVYAVEEGTVVASGFHNKNGNFVVIKHQYAGKDYYSYYLHLDSYLNKSSVRKGETIGVMGSTGESSLGEHLHFALTDTLNSSGGIFGYYRVNDVETKFSGDYIDYNFIRFYNPARYFSEGPLFITNNYR